MFQGFYLCSRITRKQKSCENCLSHHKKFTGGSRQGVTGEIIKDSQQLLGDGVQESLKEAGIIGNWF